MKLHIKIAILIAIIAILVGVFNVYWTVANIKQVLQKNLVARATVISQKVLNENAGVLEHDDFSLVTVNLHRLLSAEVGVDYIYNSPSKQGSSEHVQQ